MHWSRGRTGRGFHSTAALQTLNFHQTPLQNLNFIHSCHCLESDNFFGVIFVGVYLLCCFFVSGCTENHVAKLSRGSFLNLHLGKLQSTEGFVCGTRTLLRSVFCAGCLHHIEQAQQIIFSQTHSERRETGIADQNDVTHVQSDDLANSLEIRVQTCCVVRFHMTAYPRRVVAIGDCAIFNHDSTLRSRQAGVQQAAEIIFARPPNFETVFRMIVCDKHCVVEVPVSLCCGGKVELLYILCGHENIDVAVEIGKTDGTVSCLKTHAANGLKVDAKYKQSVYFPEQGVNVRRGRHFLHCFRHTGQLVDVCS